MFVDKRIPMYIPQGGVTYGNYTFQKVIGIGGCGISYLAWDIQNERYCVLKEFYPEELCSYFIRENGFLHLKNGCRNDYQEWMSYCNEYECNISNEAYLDSRNIINSTFAGSNSPYVYRSRSIDDYSMNSDVSFLKIETSTGVTLKEWIERNSNVGIIDKIRVVMSVYDAVDNSLHKKGIIHGDLNPRNIFISGSNTIILDFGTAIHKNGVSEKEIFSTYLSAASPRYASERKKEILMQISEYKMRVQIDAASEELIMIKKEIINKVNKLSEYDDYYTMYIILFFLVFGKYPFTDELLLSEEIHAFILHQDVNPIIKNVMITLATEFSKENVEYIENNFYKMLHRLIASENPDSDEYLISKICTDSIEKYRNVHTRYMADCINIHTGEDDSCNYDSFKNRIISSIKANQNNKLYLGNQITSALNSDIKYKGKTCFLQNLCYDLSIEFPQHGILPIYVSSDLEKIVKYVKQFENYTLLILIDDIVIPNELCRDFETCCILSCIEGNGVDGNIFQNSIRKESIITDELKVEKGTQLFRILRNNISLLARARELYYTTGELNFNLYSLLKKDIEDKLSSVAINDMDLLYLDLINIATETINGDGVITNNFRISSNFVKHRITGIIQEKEKDRYQFIDVNHLYLLLACRMIDEIDEQVCNDDTLLANHKFIKYPVLMKLCADYLQEKYKDDLSSLRWDSICRKSKLATYAINIVAIYSNMNNITYDCTITGVSFLGRHGVFEENFPYFGKRVIFSECEFFSDCFKPQLNQMIIYQGLPCICNDTITSIQNKKEVLVNRNDRGYCVEINEEVYELMGDEYIQYNTTDIQVIKGYEYNNERAGKRNPVFGTKKIFIGTRCTKYKEHYQMLSCSDVDHVVKLMGSSSECYLEWMNDKVLFQTQIFTGRKEEEFLYPFYIFEVNNVVLIGYKYAEYLEQILKSGVTYSSSVCSQIDYIRIYKRIDDKIHFLCDYSNRVQGACIMRNNDCNYLVIWSESCKLDIYVVNEEEKKLTNHSKLEFNGLYTSMVTDGRRTLVFASDRSDKLLFLRPFENWKNEIYIGRIFSMDSLLFNRRGGITFVPFSSQYELCYFDFATGKLSLYPKSETRNSYDVSSEYSEGTSVLKNMEFHDCKFIYGDANNWCNDMFIMDYVNQYAIVKDTTNSWQHRFLTELDSREGMLSTINAYFGKDWPIEEPDVIKVIEFIADVLTQKLSIKVRRLMVNYFLYKISAYEKEHIEQYRKLYAFFEDGYLRSNIFEAENSVREVILWTILSDFSKDDCKRKLKWINRVLFSKEDYSFSQSMYRVAEQYYLHYKKDSEDPLVDFLFEEALKFCHWSSEVEAIQTYNEYMLYGKDRAKTLIFRVKEMEQRILKSIDSNGDEI